MPEPDSVPGRVSVKLERHGSGRYTWKIELFGIYCVTDEELPEKLKLLDDAMKERFAAHPDPSPLNIGEQH